MESARGINVVSFNHRLEVDLDGLLERVGFGLVEVDLLRGPALGARVRDRRELEEVGGLRDALAADVELPVVVGVGEGSPPVGEQAADLDGLRGSAASVAMSGTFSKASLR